MEEKYIERLLELIAHDLRVKRGESVYLTAKECGLRAETVHKLEDSEVKGSATALCRYIDSYCRRFPHSAYLLFYNMSILICQMKIGFDEKR